MFFLWVQVSDTCVCIPWVVKLKREGFSLPLGSLTLGSRSSSKKEWAQASRGVSRAVGVYSSRREQRAMASGGVRGRNTWKPIIHKVRWWQRSYQVFSTVSVKTHTKWTHFLHEELMFRGFYETCCTYRDVTVSMKGCEWINKCIRLLQQWTAVNWTQLQRATTAGCLRDQQKVLQLCTDWMTLLSNGRALGGTAEGQSGRKNVL